MDARKSAAAATALRFFKGIKTAEEGLRRSTPSAEEPFSGNGTDIADDIGHAADAVGDDEQENRAAVAGDEPLIYFTPDWEISWMPGPDLRSCELTLPSGHRMSARPASPGWKWTRAADWER